MISFKSLVPIVIISGRVLGLQPSPGFDIQQVVTSALNIPSHSWEYGTAAQAALEFYDAQSSVYGEKPFPVPSLDVKAVKALAYAAEKIKLGGEHGLSGGDGAPADPASLGVSAVLLGKTDSKYAVAARDTILYLLNNVPRLPNGGISHRAANPVAWSDFMSMVPPFLAYYAADIQNATLLLESVNQCGHYREILSNGKGAWKHIIGREPQHEEDFGLWSTGNGWAAAGMTRVLATVVKAPVSLNIDWKQTAIDDLTKWIMEILDAVVASPLDGGLVRNYLDPEHREKHGFGEISGSSLFASVIYRMAVLQPKSCGKSYIEWADKIRGVLGGKDEHGNPHITDGGIATPAVNPLGWLDPKPFTTGSPEGQAFVVMMYSAWRDCLSSGICTDNTNKSRRLHRRRRSFNAGH